MEPTKYLMFGAHGTRPWWYTDATNNLPPADFGEWSGLTEEEARAFAKKGMYMHECVQDADRYWEEIHKLAEENHE